MSIICAMYETGVGVWLGSDTLLSAGNEILGHTDTKWVIRGNRALGVTGYYCALSALRDFPAVLDEPTGRPFRVYQAVRTYLLDVGCPKREHGQPDVALLYVDGKDIYDIDSLGGITNRGRGVFNAQGSGTYEAKGAAFVAQRDEWNAQNTVNLAVEAAIDGNLNCGGKPWLKLMNVKDSY